MAADLSRSQRQRLLFLLFAALSGAGTWAFVWPDWQQLQERRAELASLATLVKRVRPADEPIASLVARTNHLRLALEGQRQRIPVAETVSQVLVELHKILQGVEVLRFYPTRLDVVVLGATALKNDVKILQQRIMIEVEGNLAALRDFLERLEQFRHPIQVRSFEMSVPKQSELLRGNKMVMSFTLAAFLLDRPLGEPNSAWRSLERVVADLAAGPGESPIPPSKLSIGMPPTPRPLPTPEPNEIFLTPPEIIETTPIVRHRRRSMPSLSYPPQWEVQGILYSTEKPTAIVGSGKGPIAVSKGDEVEDGWVVERVEPRKIVVRKGELRRDLYLRDAKSPHE